MSYRFFQKARLSICAAAFLAASCSTAGYKDDVTEIGSASVRIDVAGLSSFDITRVVVVAGGGIENELTRDNTTGAFVGTLLLPAGPTLIVGRAFNASGQLVGESTPVSIDVQAGFAVAASLRILDLVGGGDIDHRPIILALTHPLSTVANQTASLEIVAVDPDQDPLDITWSSNCADAQFSDASAAQTQWSKADQGACIISVSATAGGLSATESFSVAVFGESTDIGAVNVDGAFVPAPTIFTSLQHGGRFCNVFEGDLDGTCQDSISSPTVAFIGVSVDWHNAEPGTITVHDDCGGLLGVFGNDPFFLNANWVPPINQTVCLITAEATSPEGVHSELSAAILVRDGQPILPRIYAQMYTPTGFCDINPESSSVTCPDLFVGMNANLNVQMDWNGLTPGTLTVVDECDGQLDIFGQDQFGLGANWRALSPNPGCRLVIRAENAGNGGIAEGTFSFQVR